MRHEYPTIEDTTQYDDQSFFTVVKTHLLTQMRRSEAESGICAYRGEEGLKCAIGAAIPDSKYQPGLEGLGASNYQILDMFPYVSPDLIEELQEIHDTRHPHIWAESLREAAKHFKLTY